jgi:hypothetical protein
MLGPIIGGTLGGVFLIIIIVVLILLLRRKRQQNRVSPDRAMNKKMGVAKDSHKPTEESRLSSTPAQIAIQKRRQQEQEDAADAAADDDDNSLQAPPITPRNVKQQSVQNLLKAAKEEAQAKEAAKAQPGLNRRTSGHIVRGHVGPLPNAPSGGAGLPPLPSTLHPLGSPGLPGLATLGASSNTGGLMPLAGSPLPPPATLAAPAPLAGTTPPAAGTPGTDGDAV